MKQLIVLIFITTAFFSCNNKTTQQPDKNNAPIALEFREETFRGNEQVHEGDSLYSEMTFRYPILSGGNKIVVNRINKYVFSLTQSSGFGEAFTVKTDLKSLGKIANEFFREAKESAVPDHPYTGAWSYDSVTDTLMFDGLKQLITMMHSYNIYIGGAHPNHFTQISNIDLQTGDTLSYNSLFGDNQQLLDAAKKRFIENEKKVMKEYNREFAMDNYWFEDGFRLPHAMGITREGIRCIYIPYEVAPYVRGPIDFVVPFTDIPDFKIKK